MFHVHFVCYNLYPVGTICNANNPCVVKALFNTTFSGVARIFDRGGLT